MNRESVISRQTIRATLYPQLTPAGQRWLGQSQELVHRDPPRVRSLFPLAGRMCGRQLLAPCPPELDGWSVDDAARALLLGATHTEGGNLRYLATKLYEHGDAAERRAVLRALPLLFAGDDGLPLLRDALRTNDTRLVAAALGPYGHDHLPVAEFRQAVLKCVFVGVPLDAVWRLDDRADAELARMLVDFARERIAAGRDVPQVWRVVDRFPDVILASGVLAELSSPEPARREAAVRALTGRPVALPIT